MITLDANDSNQVASANVVRATLTDADEEMVICSAIAIPEWNTFEDDYIASETAIINLRETVLAIKQATVSVGLASIGNGNTNFEFALNDTSLSVDPITQEMKLSVDMALMGNPSALDRFSYQVVARVTKQVTGIDGTINWTSALFDASGLSPTQVAQLFQVSAGTSAYVPPASGKGFGSTVYTPRAFGTTGALQNNNGNFVLPYTIPGAPYGVNLSVTVGINAGFASGRQNIAEQISGPNPVVLTTGSPGIKGVDFSIGYLNVR
jgi:hypothetical protein